LFDLFKYIPNTKIKQESNQTFGAILIFAPFVRSIINPSSSLITATKLLSGHYFYYLPIVLDIPKVKLNEIHCLDKNPVFNDSMRRRHGYKNQLTD
jgi:hypothetical protein